MTYDRDNMKNPRSTPEGRKADSQVRAGTYSETGRDAGHRHGLSGNAPPEDRGNVYPQNTIQNRAGGTKRLEEETRDKAIRNGSATSITEESKLIRSDREGYGDRVPAAEKVTHTYTSLEGEKSTRTVYFANTPSSSSRYADAQAKKGEAADPEELKRLTAQDRANFRAQGHGTARQNQEHVKDLQAREAKGEKVEWGPRLAVDNTQPPPRSTGNASPPERPAADASKVSGPPDRGRSREGPPSGPPSRSTPSAATDEPPKTPPARSR
jgi:hypothetical protein